LAKKGEFEIGHAPFDPLAKSTGPFEQGLEGTVAEHAGIFEPVRPKDDGRAIERRHCRLRAQT